MTGTVKSASQSSITSLMMLGILSATLLYTLIFCAIIYSQLDETLDALRYRSLKQQAYDIASMLDRPATAPNGTADEGAVDASAPLSQYIVREAATGTVIMHSPLAQAADFPNPSSTDTEPYFSFRNASGTTYIGASIRYQSQGREYIIQIAQSEVSVRTFSDILTKDFFQRISLFGVPFLFLLMLVIAATIRLIMTPMAKAMSQAQRISFNNPEVRLNDSTFPTEIRPLALAVNEALDRLEQGITAQKDFIANAAHELRTPLAVLRTHVDLIPDRDMANRIRGDVDTMARLVNQLLDTARLESPQPPEMSMVDLSAVVRSVSQAIWPLIVKEEHSLDVEGLDRSIAVRGNFDMLARALRNLLENALKHTPKGTRITVSVVPEGIRVEDNGPGIAPGDGERIFEKFSRRDMQSGNGAGLGLYIVKRIMKLHGGRVDAGNCDNGGCRFTLHFPGLPESDGADAEPGPLP